MHSQSTNKADELGPWAKDVEADLLTAQLECLDAAVLAGSPSKVKSIGAIAQVLAKQGGTVRAMLSEVVRLVELVATVPVSGASV